MRPKHALYLAYLLGVAAGWLFAAWDAHWWAVVGAGLTAGVVLGWLRRFVER